jgi:GntR family transcriptional regulator
MPPKNADNNGASARGLPFSVDRDDPMPLHDQVAAEIRRAIAEGEIGPGERLPPAVDLAAVLGVNKNTVLRALHLLKNEGTVDFTRGRGIRITGGPDRSEVITRVRDLLDFARERGYRGQDIVEIIESVS